MTAGSHPLREQGPRAWFMRNAGRPIVALFRQGLSPEKIAQCIVLGAFLALFPVLGTTTLLCTAAAVPLRLNLPAIQAVNWLMAGPQLVMIPVFLRIGESMAGAPPIVVQPEVWAQAFRDSPAEFFARFGVAGLHSILGWAAAATPAAVIAYALLLRLLRHRTAPAQAAS